MQELGDEFICRQPQVRRTAAQSDTNIHRQAESDSARGCRRKSFLRGGWGWQVAGPFHCAFSRSIEPLDLAIFSGADGFGDDLVKRGSNAREIRRAPWLLASASIAFCVAQFPLPWQNYGNFTMLSTSCFDR